MNIFSLIVTIFVLSFVMTEALYVHKIMDQAEPVPKTVQMCRRSCLKNVRIIFTEEFIEPKFKTKIFITVYKRKYIHPGKHRPMQQQLDVLHVLGLLWSSLS